MLTCVPIVSIPALADLAPVLSRSLWVMLAAVLALGVAGIFAGVAVKRWSRREEAVEVFTLQDLREMRDRGEITEAEFAALRAEVLGRAAAGASAASTDESGPQDGGDPGESSA